MASAIVVGAMDIMSTILPVLIILAIYMLILKRQRRDGISVLEQLSSKSEIEALRGEMKLMIEKQDRVIESLSEIKRKLG